MKLATLRNIFIKYANKVFALKISKKDNEIFSLDEEDQILLILNKVNDSFKLIKKCDISSNRINVFCESSDQERDVLFDLFEQEMGVRPIQHGKTNIFMIKI